MLETGYNMHRNIRYDLLLRPDGKNVLKNFPERGRNMESENNRQYGKRGEDI